MKNNATRNLIIISDLHAGCKLALCPIGGVPLDDGGVYMPSAGQQQLWAWWRELWDVWVPAVTHGEPYAVVMNGDALDGVHHNSVTQISHNLADQAAIADTLLGPVVDACDGRYFHIRGTEAHVGKSGQEEERLAKMLGAVPNESGQYARWELWTRVGEGLVHLLHHVGTTSSSAYEPTAVYKELVEAFVEAGRWRDEPPSIVVRSHRHRCIEIRIPSDAVYSSVFTTPAWQLRTPFAMKTPGARQSQPQIGASLIRQGDEELHTRHFVRRPARSKEER